MRIKSFMDFREIPTNVSIFAELSESINLGEIEQAGERLNGYGNPKA